MATDFGKRLIRARNHAKLTQEQLGALVPMAQSTLASAEAGGFGSRKTPQIAAACGVSAHWLATGEGEMLDGIVNVATLPAARYHKPPDAADLVAHLARLLAAHTPARQRTLADVLSRFACDPASAELAAELALQLTPPAGADANKQRSA